MARLADIREARELATDSRTWLPLLILALLWALAGGTQYFSLFQVSALPWHLLAVGSAGYLFTVVGFTLRGDAGPHRNMQMRIATAFSVGIALAFSAFALEWSTNASGLTGAPSVSAPPAKPSASDPLSPVNALAAVLALVLAVLTLIAQKTANDARAEAERARQDILQALDVRVLASGSRLLERAQAANSEADDLLIEADEIALQDEEVARVLRLGTDSLERLARFFVLVHQWILEPHLTPSKDLTARAAVLVLDLQALERAIQAVGNRVRDREKRLRVEFWQPACRLLDSLLESLHGSRALRAATEAEQAMRALREVRATLARL